MKELKWISFTIFMTGAIGNLVAAIMDKYEPLFTIHILLGLLGWAIYAALKEVMGKDSK